MSSQKRKANWRKSNRASSNRQPSPKRHSRFGSSVWTFIVPIVLIVPVAAVIVFQSIPATAMRPSDGDTTVAMLHSPLPTPADSVLGNSEANVASPYPYFYPDTEVLVYTGRGDTGWQPMPFGAVPWGVEFLFDGRFYDVDPEGRVRVNLSVEASETNLAEADRPFEPYNSRWPEPEDLVRFVDQDNRHLFHNRAGTFQAGDRFWFQGVLYEGIADPDDPSGRVLRSTDYVLSNGGRRVSVEEFAIARGDSLDEVHGSQASSAVAAGSGGDRQPGNGCVVLASFHKSHDLPNGVVLSRNENSDTQSITGSGGMPTDFGFAGHRYDRSTGLIYMGARYYDPALGRFISPDPTVPELGNPQSLNRYSYVENNPVTFIDPYGLEKVIIVYGTYNDTNSFRAAAETQYQMALEAGYAEGDILLMAVGTDADVFAAIAGSGTNEIEFLYIFSHGWSGGLQLKAGANDEYQFTVEDLGAEAIGLQDRFAQNAEFHIRACQVAKGTFAQSVADAFDVTVYASERSMRFWKAHNWETRRQVFGIPIYEWIDAPLGGVDEWSSSWVPYDGAGTYSGNAHVIMMPYVLGEVSKFGLTVDLAMMWPSAYVPFEPQRLDATR